MSLFTEDFNPNISMSLRPFTLDCIPLIVGPFGATVLWAGQNLYAKSSKPSGQKNLFNDMIEKAVEERQEMNLSIKC